MVLGVEAMDPTVAAILFLIAVVFFAIAAFVAREGLGWLVPAGLAVATFVLMWDRFAVA